MVPVTALEPLFALADRLAGGSKSTIVIDEHLREHPRTRRAFTAILWLLAIETVLSIGIIVVAAVLVAHGEHVPIAVWFRGVAVLGITLTLFFFAARARAGRYYAYWRLRLFSQIFPIVALVIAAVPGLYPIWMTSEQIVFALLLIGVGDYLKSDHMRQVFAKPA